MAQSLADLFFIYGWRPHDLYPDAPSTLDDIGARFRVGFLTNGNTDPERSALAGRFNFIVTAANSGLEKPDRRYYEAALRKAGCESGEMVHVGDSLHDDIEGAKSLGIRTVWINRLNRPHMPGIEPDAEIHSLTELSSLLAEWTRDDWQPFRN